MDGTKNRDFKLTFEELMENDHVQIAIAAIIQPIEAMKKSMKQMAFFSLIMFFHSVCNFIEQRLEMGKEVSWAFTLGYSSYELVQSGFLSVSFNMWIKQINHYLSIWYFGKSYVMPRYYGMLILLKFNSFVYSLLFPDPEARKKKSSEKSILSAIKDMYNGSIESPVDDERAKEIMKMIAKAKEEKAEEEKMKDE